MCLSDKISFEALSGSVSEGSNSEISLDLEALISDHPSSACMEALSDDQASVKSEDSSPRLKFLCSYGGKFLPRPHDHQLRYAGGETRVVVLNRNISFKDLMEKLRKIAGADVCLRYKLPHEDLDALVSVLSDEDIQNMMDEYEKADSLECSCRIRLFLFIQQQPPVRSNDDPAGGGPRNAEEQFLEAVNSVASISKNPPFQTNQEACGCNQPARSPSAAFHKAPAMAVYPPIIGRQHFLPSSVDISKPLKHAVMDRKPAHQTQVQISAWTNNFSTKPPAPEFCDYYDSDHSPSSGSSSASPRELRRDQHFNTSELEPENQMMRLSQEQSPPRAKLLRGYTPFHEAAHMKPPFSARSAFTATSAPGIVPSLAISQAFCDDPFSHPVSSPRRIAPMQSAPVCKTNVVCRDQPCMLDYCKQRGSNSCRFCDQSVSKDRNFMPPHSFSESPMKDYQKTAMNVHNPFSAVQAYNQELQSFYPLKCGGGTATLRDYGNNQHNVSLYRPQQQGSKQVLLH